LQDVLPDANLEGEDHEYYTPKFFKRSIDNLTREETYQFNEANTENGRNYWADREKHDWSHMPNLFDNDCRPFY